jgi:hypothetical protein
MALASQPRLAGRLREDEGNVFRRRLLNREKNRRLTRRQRGSHRGDNEKEEDENGQLKSLAPPKIFTRINMLFGIVGRGGGKLVPKWTQEIARPDLAWRRDQCLQRRSGLDRETRTRKNRGPTLQLKVIMNSGYQIKPATMIPLRIIVNSIIT